MKKYFFVLFISTLFIPAVVAQEDILYGTTWEMEIEGLSQMILLEGMLWLKLDEYDDDVYLSKNIIYDNGKIIEEFISSVLFLYEIYENELRLISDSTGKTYKQIQTSDDLLVKTKFQGNWVTIDSFGEKDYRETLLFFGNFISIQNNRGIDVLVSKFNYDDDQIIISFGSETIYTKYILNDNQMKLITEENELILYRE